MNYYFAGAYARRAELARRGGELVRAVPAAKIVSSWLIDDQAGLDGGFSAGNLTTPEAITAAWHYGGQDMNDLLTAGAIVSFTGEGGRGGRHAEHGMAILIHERHPVSFLSNPPMRLIIIGPREHVFHCHPATEVYPDFAAFLAHETGQGLQD